MNFLTPGVDTICVRQTLNGGVCYIHHEKNPALFSRKNFRDFKKRGKRN